MYICMYIHACYRRSFYINISFSYSLVKIYKHVTTFHPPWCCTWYVAVYLWQYVKNTCIYVYMYTHTVCCGFVYITHKCFRQQRYRVYIHIWTQKSFLNTFMDHKIAIWTQFIQVMMLEEEVSIVANTRKGPHLYICTHAMYIHVHVY